MLVSWKIWAVFLACLIVELVGCGFVEGPEYVKYEGTSSETTTNETSEECQSAALTFAQTYHVKITESSCLGCHESGKSNSGSITFSSTDDSVNRQAVKNSNYYPSATTFYEFISGSSHPGSSSVDSSHQDSLSQWAADEDNCT